jgi:hypothetical protein
MVNPTSDRFFELVRKTVARVGRIDMRTQAQVRIARKTDTPPSAVGAPKRPSPSARERARDNEKGRAWPRASAASPPGGGGMVF